jgi:hypothetical protein
MISDVVNLTLPGIPTCSIKHSTRLLLLYDRVVLAISDSGISAQPMRSHGVRELRPEIRNEDNSGSTLQNWTCFS